MHLKRLSFLLATPFLFAISGQNFHVSSCNPELSLDSAIARCAAPASARAALERSDAVFSGKIVSINEENRIVRLDFEVERRWKGKKQKTMTVTVFKDPRYAPSFNTGEKYLVYGIQNTNGEMIGFGRCTRSKLLKYAADDVKQLDAKR